MSIKFVCVCVYINLAEHHAPSTKLRCQVSRLTSWNQINIQISQLITLIFMWLQMRINYGGRTSAHYKASMLIFSLWAMGFQINNVNEHTREPPNTHYPTFKCNVLLDIDYIILSAGSPKGYLTSSFLTFLRERLWKKTSQMTPELAH